MHKSKEHFLMMYHGKLMPERGIETLIDTLMLNPKLYLFLLGDGRQDYISYLEETARKKKVSGRMKVHEAIPYQELWKYIGAADVGMITVKAAWKSYYYMLPNKFFENIQSETPVICSDFPAVRDIMNRYQIGMVCDPDDPKEINQCIYKLWSDEEFYQTCKKNLLIAKNEFCWEKERRILKEAYSKIL